MTELTRPLTRLNATAMVAGTIIGASIFVQPSEIARYLATPTAIMSVWLACGVLTLFGALVCAELASAFPRTGGVYVFLREIYSPALGFLWGWGMFWSMHSGIIAAIAMVFARYATFFVPAGDRGTRAIAVAIILVLSALNYVGERCRVGGTTLARGEELIQGNAWLLGRITNAADGEPIEGATWSLSYRDFLGERRIFENAGVGSDGIFQFCQLERGATVVVDARATGMTGRAQDQRSGQQWRRPRPDISS